MRIAYDAKRFFHNNTGLGNYARNLINSMHRHHADHEYLLFANRTDRSPFSHYRDLYKVRDSKSRIPALYRSFSIHQDLNDQQVDIYHGISNELPLSSTEIRAKKIVTIHDLFYKTYPQDFKPIDRLIYDKKTSYSAKIADHIVAISQATKRDLIQYLKVDSERITVIYQTCNPEYQINKMVKKPESLPVEYMLQVGSINKRKNLMGVIEAMKTIPKSDRLPLVVVGNDRVKYARTLQEKISEYQLTDDVIFLGALDNDTLVSLYTHARFSLFPSHYEGFGIPVIESLFCGTPVITSENSSLPEALGPCGILVKSTDTDALKNAIISLTLDDRLLERYTSKIDKHIHKFKSENTSKQMINLYQKLT